MCTRRSHDTISDGADCLFPRSRPPMPRQTIRLKTTQRHPDKAGLWARGCPWTKFSPAPGEFPYTRGIHPTMYRRRLWTMRQFSGFATPGRKTNRRYPLSAGARADGPLGRVLTCRPRWATMPTIRWPPARWESAASLSLLRSRIWKTLFRGITARRRDGFDDHSNSPAPIPVGPCTWPSRSSRESPGRRYPELCKTTF